MGNMPEALIVNLGERSYPILFGADLTAAIRDKVGSLGAAGRKIAVLTDRHVADLQGAALRALVWGCPIPGRRRRGGDQVGGRTWPRARFSRGAKLSRADALFVVGGGVVGDLGGFAAASYLRGIDYYQVPTTLLAMVDSSVGGKTGVNLAAGKNLAGAFHQPRGVFVATGFLRTLPAREFAAGVAEVVKYGMLGDAALFAELERLPLRGDSPALAAVIRRCCAIKARIVEADERELAPEGGRALLNLGHTLGHAIEQSAGYGVYLHGEAVAIGLAAAARLSQKLGRLAAGDVIRVDSILVAHGLPVRLRVAAGPRPICQAAMARDKKVRAGALRFVVLRSLGGRRHAGRG